ncbi:DUF61 family protein [Thermococcus peptonophilus]|uniref:UPF0216 protein A0127_06185 n=1 Tax=Thermococcus peptonophilus TaxID=53952 RepID=A0A142CVI7_9EURY|nr:DUF61 family protein [Thermococcus peptonophilus]AMQ18789.1 hypothetical protein A0127_06185 [Thermococcus peptonophilus]
MSKIEDILNREIMRVNLHLPRRRVTLGDLIDGGKDYVTLRDGSRHYFRSSELEYLSSILDEDEKNRLMLPIVLEISTVDRGYFRVRGKIEVKVIETVLGQFDPLEEKSEGRYPRYLLPRIRRVLPTTTTYAFIME